MEHSWRRRLSKEGNNIGAVDAVLLAAGAGRRFGGDKLTAAWRGRPLVTAALERALPPPVRRVVLVWGESEAPATAAAAFAREAGAAERYLAVRAEHAARGLAWSLKAGIGALPEDCAAAAVFLADMPRVDPAATGALARALEDGALAAAPVWNGRRGHPVLLSRALFPALLELTGDQGAGRVLETLGERLALVPARDDGCLFDIDVREDIADAAPDADG